MVYTEMISAEGLVRNRKATEGLMKSCPEERPLAVQIFGVRPQSLAGAARIAEECGAELVDINMGCPVRKVTNGGSGAALMKDPLRAGEIMEAVRKSVSIPVTVKIRAGWDEKTRNYLEIGRIAEECGDELPHAPWTHPRARVWGQGRLGGRCRSEEAPPDPGDRQRRPEFPRGGQAASSP